MAHWAQAKDGNFNTRKDWNPRRVPVYNAKHKDDAILDAVGGAYTVTVTTNEDVKSLQTASNATLSLTGAGTFVVNAGTGAGANAGSILVGDGYTLQFNGGTIDNTGGIFLNAGAANAFVNLQSGVTLQGGGTITLGDNAFNGIVDTLASTTATLTNVDNTISGAGVIGSGGILGGGTLTLVNQAGGVIDATGVNNPLILNTPGATLTNNGLIEATTGAGLNIAATTVDGSGGGVIVANDSQVRLQAAVIVGGTLKTFNAGEIQASGGTALDGTVSTVHNKGQFIDLDGNSLLVQGAIDNSGLIDIAGRISGSSMVLSGNLTLTGGGGVLLEDNASNYIQASTPAGTLTNFDNTITADGQLGAGQLILVNQAGGVIEETGKSGLTIDTGAATITNAGLIEAHGNGGITIQSAVNNSGVIELLAADISGGSMMMIDGTVRNTGKLVVDGGTMMVFEAVTGSGSATIKLGTLYFGSSFNQNVTFTSQSGILELAQSQSYTRTVTGIAKNGQGDILDLDDIAFVGADQATYVDNGSHTGGVLTVTDGTHTAHIKLAGDYDPSRFGSFDDGHGVGVFYKAAPAVTPALGASHGFVAAMASFGADAGGPAHAAIEAHYVRPAMLAVPRMAMA
ncbi:MAG: hypothetical protein ABI906_01415 [Pseudomonadota bacterium]